MSEDNTQKYDTLMDVQSDPVSFISIYEEVIEARLLKDEVPDSIRGLLRDKRLFGLQKYGDRSFQSSLENAVKTPIIDHLKDELIDALNYIQHMRFLQALGRCSSIRSDDLSELQTTLVWMIKRLMNV